MSRKYSKAVYLGEQAQEAAYNPDRANRPTAEFCCIAARKQGPVRTRGLEYGAGGEVKAPHKVFKALLCQCVI